MALPTGTFSSPDAGTLVLMFSGDWTYREGDWGAGTWDILLRGYAGPAGSLTYSAILSIKGQSASLVLPYPGGNVSWQIGMEYVHHTFGGAGSISASNLRVSGILIKR